MPQSNLNNAYPQLQDKVILNVDDNEMNQLVLTKIIENAGMKMIHAESGAEAVRKLKEGLKPDVILMDLEMPVMNGLQASEFIKNKIDSHIPIIINSGAVSAYQRFRLKRIGIHDFLEKPYSLIDIFSKITKNLSNILTSSQF